MELVSQPAARSSSQAAVGTGGTGSTDSVDGADSAGSAPQAAALVKQLLSRDPGRRPSADRVLRTSDYVRSHVQSVLSHTMGGHALNLSRDAVRRDDGAAVEALVLDKGAAVDHRPRDGRYPCLHQAAMDGRAVAVAALLRLGRRCLHASAVRRMPQHTMNRGPVIVTCAVTGSGASAKLRVHILGEAGSSLKSKRWIDDNIDGAFLDFFTLPLGSFSTSA